MRAAPAPSPAERAAREGGRRVLGFAVLAAAAGLATALVLALIAQAVTGPVAALTVSSVEVEVDPAEDIALDTLGERSTVNAADGTLLAILQDEVDRRVIGFDEMPDHLRQAVIAAEDRRFYEHEGYDAEAIGRAVLANVRAGDVQQGGSTITQQLAKLNLVGDETTVQRKLEEVAAAVGIEQKLSKDEILERYLNQVYFGAGAYGVAAAADEYFRVEPAELTIAQAATLAAAIRAPEALNPRRNPEGLLQRRDAVIDGMRVIGAIDADEAEAALAEELEVAEPLGPPEVTEPYVVEAVKREFLELEEVGASREDRLAALFSGGLRIETTVNPVLQDHARDVVTARYGSGSPTAAIVALEPSTGRIRAIHAGTDFEAEQFDLATQARRQPGSAFKPFVAAAALERGGWTGMTLEGESPTFFEEVRGWEEENDGVSNFDGQDFEDPTLREAMRNSVNTAFADLILDVGVDAVRDVATRLGVADAAFGEGDGPAIALGGLGNGTTPLELASAYGTIANEGVRAAPFLISRVEDRNGEVLYEGGQRQEQAIDPSIAADLRSMLTDVVEEGTGTAARLPGHDAFGKTGTTQNNADAWFVGATDELAAAAWVGHPEGQVRMPGATGGGWVAPLWRDFMQTALEEME